MAHRNIENQINLLLSEIGNFQSDDGEIISFRSSTEDLQNSERIKNVFVTGLILHFLEILPDEVQNSKLIKNSINYLVAHQEKDFTWRFFGKGSKIVADIDDTIVILSSLQKAHILLNYSDLLSSFLQNRTSEGIFYTWFPDKGESNNIDWVVNANVYLFYKKAGFNLPNVKEYLIDIVKKKKYKSGSLYYHSHYYFLYIISEIYLLDNDFNEISNDIIGELSIDSLNENHNLTFFCLKVLTLYNLKYSKIHTFDKNIDNLLDIIENKAVMPYSIFRHRSINKYYGSEALTSAILLKTIYRISYGK